MHSLLELGQSWNTHDALHFLRLLFLIRKAQISHSIYADERGKKAIYVSIWKKKSQKNEIKN